VGTTEWTLVVIALVNIVFGLFGWLLVNKDAKQEETMKGNKKEADDAIAILFAEHKVDAAKLAALELDLARNYNPKHEITGLFDGFKLYLNERFDRIEQSLGVERRKS
jgi:hypothetical protein